MNYRHHFHAGNFADVMKHVMLVRLFRALQGKEKPLLYLDTHAGRGGYDLERAATGDTLARKPEWPDGIGRLLNRAGPVPQPIDDYLQLVRAFDNQTRSQGGGSGIPAGEVHFYPGSPWLARMIRRGQDRLALCEQHPDECEVLRADFARVPRVSVQEMDGYGAIRALLPPPERRALVVIDPPFEAQDEFARVASALGEGLERFPAAVYAAWYPLTLRARVDEFLGAVERLKPPPTLAMELMIAGEQSPLRMKGCGLLVINPPWQFDREAAAVLDCLSEVLAQAPGGAGRIDWLVPER
ncbi:MAG: 23S rRNA (adenine(2030)-N(6))-methyltransferase RlmJ [Opitutus sp.]